MQGAKVMLEKAFEIQKTLPPENPHRAKVHYFYALIQEADGNYDTAIEHLQHAASQFPRDTRVRNKLGRMHFLKRNYEPRYLNSKRPSPLTQKIWTHITI